VRPAQNRPQQSRLSQCLSKGDVPKFRRRTVATVAAVAAAPLPTPTPGDFDTSFDGEVWWLGGGGGGGRGDGGAASIWGWAGALFLRCVAIVLLVLLWKSVDIPCTCITKYSDLVQSFSLLLRPPFQANKLNCHTLQTLISKYGRGDRGKEDGPTSRTDTDNNNDEITSTGNMEPGSKWEASSG